MEIQPSSREEREKSELVFDHVALLVNCSLASLSVHSPSLCFFVIVRLSVSCLLCVCSELVFDHVALLVNCSLASLSVHQFVSLLCVCLLCVRVCVLSLSLITSLCR